jgi:hypothetical protein
MSSNHQTDGEACFLNRHLARPTVALSVYRRDQLTVKLSLRSFDGDYRARVRGTGDIVNAGELA